MLSRVVAEVGLKHLSGKETQLSGSLSSSTTSRSLWVP